MDHEKVLGEHKFPTYEELKTGLIQLIDEGKISREDAARLLPELRESEDERIRKYLIEELKAAKSVGELKFIIPQPTREECIVYLEKQKESLHVQETYKENADSFTSEDERIRKEIVDFLETIPASELKRIPRPISEWFAWLEKQKESHIPWYDYQKSKEAGYTIVPNEGYEQLIKQKEQKPQVFCEAKAYDLGYKQGKEDAIKEQKPAVSREEILHQLFQNGSITLSDYLYLTEEQKPTWSEEDEKIMESLISLIETIGEYYISLETIDRYVAWLKSLRPSWKPSEEQMEVFQNTMQRLLQAGGTGKWYSVLESLYEQLKKL